MSWMFQIKIIAWPNKEANKENNNSQGSTGGSSYSNATLVGRGPIYMHHQSSLSTHVTPDLNSTNAIYQQRTPNLPFMSRVLAWRKVSEKIHLRQMFRPIPGFHRRYLLRSLFIIVLITSLTGRKGTQIRRHMHIDKSTKAHISISYLDINIWIFTTYNESDCMRQIQQWLHGPSVHDLTSAPSSFQVSKQGFLFKLRCIPRRHWDHLQNLNCFRTRRRHFQINDWRSRQVLLPHAFPSLCKLVCSPPSHLEAPR